MDYPVSESAFYKVLDAFIEKLFEVVSPATVITLQNILCDIDPEIYDMNDFENFVEEWVFDIYKWTSTPKGLKEYLNERINNEDKDIFAVSWSIGECYEIEGVDYACDYKDKDSFLDDVNSIQVIQIMNKCWARACITDQPFSDDETIKLLTSDRIGTSEFI